MMNIVKTSKGWYWINEKRRVKGHAFWEGPFSTEELAKNHAAQQGVQLTGLMRPNPSGDLPADVRESEAVLPEPPRN